MDLVQIIDFIRQWCSSASAEDLKAFFVQLHLIDVFKAERLEWHTNQLCEERRAAQKAQETAVANARKEAESNADADRTAFLKQQQELKDELEAARRAQDTAVANALKEAASNADADRTALLKQQQGLKDELEALQKAQETAVANARKEAESNADADRTAFCAARRSSHN